MGREWKGFINHTFRCQTDVILKLNMIYVRNQELWMPFTHLNVLSQVKPFTRIFRAQDTFFLKIQHPTSPPWQFFAIVLMILSVNWTFLGKEEKSWLIQRGRGRWGDSQCTCVMYMSDVKTVDYSKKWNNDLCKGGVRQVVSSGEWWESWPTMHFSCRVPVANSYFPLRARKKAREGR